MPLLALLSLRAAKEGEPLQLDYSNRSFNNSAFLVGRIHLLAPQLNHKNRELKARRKGLFHRSKIPHEFALFFCQCKNPPPPPFNSFIQLVGLLCCWGFLFVCLKKACKLRLFP